MLEAKDLGYCPTANQILCNNAMQELARLDNILLACTTSEERYAQLFTKITGREPNKQLTSAMRVLMAQSLPF